MIHLFPKFAMHNRHLMLGPSAGCFHCCQLFKKEEIKDYSDGDKTCVCPRCGVDCVVGDTFGFTLDEEILKKANAFWFSKR